VRLAPFVDDADVIVVDSRETGIAGPQSLIEQMMARRRPGSPVIETRLNRLLGPPLLGVGIREQQDVPLGPGELRIDRQQTGVAVRFDEPTATGFVLAPGLAQVAGDISPRETARDRCGC
jgi:hypothetical protein